MQKPKLYIKESVVQDYEKGKKLEVRPFNGFLNLLRAGETLRLESSRKMLKRKVLRKTNYWGYEAVMKNENLSDIFPGVTTEAEFLRRVSFFYPLQELKNKQLVVLELEPIAD